MCFVLLAVPVHAALGDRHVEQAGGFSLQAPKGWQFRDFPGMKYQIAFGPASNSFSPNINVVDEAYDGSLKSYVDGNEQSVKKLFEQYKRIKREAFTTKSGLKGERLVTTSVQQKNKLRQSFYFFPAGKGRYFVVTCSAHAAGGESLDAIFEESLRSFELVR
jgi:hypothetical protein